MEVRAERTIRARPAEVFDAWLDPEHPASPWHRHDRLIAHPQPDGLWYWLVDGNHHYGRFIEVARPGRLQMSWVSFYTRGEESVVTVTFADKAGSTLLTLRHSGLPDDEMGREHTGGWASILDALVAEFSGAARQSA